MESISNKEGSIRESLDEFRNLVISVFGGDLLGADGEHVSIALSACPNLWSLMSRYCDYSLKNGLPSEEKFDELFLKIEGVIEQSENELNPSTLGRAVEVLKRELDGAITELKKVHEGLEK